MDTYTLRSRSDAQPAQRFRIDYAGELNAARITGNGRTSAW